MKRSTRSLLRVIISLVYIVWGIWAPINAFNAILALNVSAMISAAIGVLTLFAGVLGLTGINKSKCRIMGVVIFVGAVISIVLSFPHINVVTIVNAVLAWLFIICI